MTIDGGSWMYLEIAAEDFRIMYGRGVQSSKAVCKDLYDSPGCSWMGTRSKC